MTSQHILNKAANLTEQAVGAGLGAVVGGGLTYAATNKKTKRRGLKVGAAALLSAIGGGLTGQHVGNKGRELQLAGLLRDKLQSTSTDITAAVNKEQARLHDKHPVLKDTSLFDDFRAAAKSDKALAYGLAEAGDDIYEGTDKGMANAVAKLLKLQDRNPGSEIADLRAEMQGELGGSSSLKGLMGRTFASLKANTDRQHHAALRAAYTSNG